MLTGSQLERLDRALRNAFDPPGFDRVMKFGLDRSRQNYSLGGDFREIVFEVLEAAEREAWTADLIVAARRANPTNPGLSVVAEELQLAPAAPPRPVLERIIVGEHAYLDVARWRERLGALEARVGRVEMVGQAAGTAFLVAPDLVLTNDHVIAPLVGAAVAPGDTVVRFDYKRLADGTVTSKGTTYALHETEWLVDRSQPSPIDTLVEQGGRLPDPSELDYALLRLAEPAGENTIGGQTGASIRGWVDKPALRWRGTGDTVSPDVGGAGSGARAARRPSEHILTPRGLRMPRRLHSGRRHTLPRPR